MSITGTALPSSANTYSGIEFYPVAVSLNILPKNIGWEGQEGTLKVSFLFGGDYSYRLLAMSHSSPEGFKVAYYSAYNLRNERTEYVIGPGRVQDFERNGELFAVAAGLFFGVGKEAHPSAIDIVVAQRYALAGKPWKSFKASFRAVKSMWKDPVMAMSAAADVGAIGSMGSLKPRAMPRSKPLQVRPPKVPAAAGRPNKALGKSSRGAGAGASTPPAQPQVPSLRRLHETQANLLNTPVQRSTRVLTRPESFRHSLTADVKAASYARIEKTAKMNISKGAKAHYGEGVYAWGPGTPNVGTYVDIELAAGTAVEQLVIPGRGQTFYRIIGVSGDTVPVTTVGTNLTEMEIRIGRMLAGD